MSIPENNGTPNRVVREWNDSRASRRPTPITPAPLTMPPLRLFVRVVLVFALFLALALCVGSL